MNSLKFSAIYDFNGNVIYSGNSIEALKKESLTKKSIVYRNLSETFFYFVQPLRNPDEMQDRRGEERSEDTI